MAHSLRNKGKVQSMTYEPPLYLPYLCTPRYSCDLAARLAHGPQPTTVPSQPADAPHCGSQRTSNRLLFTTRHPSPPDALRPGCTPPYTVQRNSESSATHPACTPPAPCPHSPSFTAPSLVHPPMTSQVTPETPSLRVPGQMRGPHGSCHFPLSTAPPPYMIGTCSRACAAPVPSPLRTEPRGCSLLNHPQLAQNWRITDIRSTATNK